MSNKHRVLLLGAGHVGRMIATMLESTGDYDVLVGDNNVKALARLQGLANVAAIQIDVTDESQLMYDMRGRDSVISALTYHFNPLIAECAVKSGLNYFDLTEDNATTKIVQDIATDANVGQILRPQCGLAPGFIAVAARHLVNEFDTVDTLHMRVGALPQYPCNALKYNLTWSTDGLINEYCNPCEAIHAGVYSHVLPLEGLERFSLEGVEYEAFNTSGGLGTLCDSLDGAVRELNYKTIRFPGHRDLASFLINDLRLREKRVLLKAILEESVPVTTQDVVVVFVTATGWLNNQYVQRSFSRTLHSVILEGTEWSAIQVTTAAGVCTALDLHVTGKLPGRGFMKQEYMHLPEFLGNRFGVEFNRGTSDV